MGKLGLLLSVTLLVTLLAIHVEARRGGGGRGGGGRSSSSSRGSRGSSYSSSSSRGSRGSSYSSSSSRGSRGSRGSSYSKPKSKKRSYAKKAAKAAVAGLAVYGAYKATKAFGKFALSPWRGYSNFGFQRWAGMAGRDGFLCRTDRDCSWMDPRLQCQNFRVTPIRTSWDSGWFGGGKSLDIVGECDCNDGFWFDTEDYDFRCQTNGILGLAIWAFAVVVLICCCCCCCCCGLAMWCYKTRR